MAKGAAEGAKVTVVEYASVTCGVCAAWQQQVWPEFKAKYVDTNQVRFVFREFPTAPEPVAVAGFLMARCAGEGNYFPVIEEIMASQQEMSGPAGPRPVLLRIANGVGLSEEQFQACVTDEDAIKAMDERIKAALDAGVGGTPTFMVNGQTVQDTSLAGLSAAVDAALAEG
jgi:protein-disulfide isomerase